MTHTCTDSAQVMLGLIVKSFSEDDDGYNQNVPSPLSAQPSHTLSGTPVTIHVIYVCMYELAALVA